MELSPEEIRVLGCLIEKERTVPDSYPMTLNGLVTACNQSSNRFPVVQYDAGLVQRTLDGLKPQGLVRFVHPSHGERTTKFRQVLDESLALRPDESAVVCVLFLRGAQTVNEIRARTERLHPFASADDVVAALEHLADRDEPLVRRLGRRPGEREERWAHLAGGEPDVEALSAGPPAAAFAAPARSGDDLEQRVAALEARLAHLEESLGLTDSDS